MLLKQTNELPYGTVSKTVHGDLTITDNKEINERLNILYKKRKNMNERYEHNCTIAYTSDFWCRPHTSTSSVPWDLTRSP